MISSYNCGLMFTSLLKFFFIYPHNPLLCHGHMYKFFIYPHNPSSCHGHMYKLATVGVLKYKRKYRTQMVSKGSTNKIK